jgi:hypothetical protein
MNFYSKFRISSFTVGAGIIHALVVMSEAQSRSPEIDGTIWNCPCMVSGAAFR